MRRCTVVPAILFALLLLCAGTPALAAAAPRTVTILPDASFTLDPDWSVQGEPAAIKSFPNFDAIRNDVKAVALRGGEVLFVMAQPARGSSLMEFALGFESLMREKAAASDKVTVYRQNFVLLACGKCRTKNRLAHLTAATGPGAVLGATAYYRARIINQVTLSVINGPWIITFVYFTPGAAAELPAAIKPLLDSLALKGFEDPREVMFKELIKYVPQGTAPECAAGMSELAALTAREYRSVDIPALFNSKSMPDWMKDTYAAPACACFKIKQACDRKSGG